MNCPLDRFKTRSTRDINFIQSAAREFGSQCIVISIDAKITGGGNQIFIEGSVAVDRSQFDVRYGSTAFFDNLGDKAIDNIFNLNVKLVGDLKK